MFYVTHCSRHVQPDSYEHGLEYPGSPESFYTEHVLHLHGPTLADAIDRACEAFALPNDYAFFGGVEDGPVRRFSCNRQEDRDGCVPTPAEIAEWMIGRGVLYLVDYDFAIEWRDVRGITAEDLASLRTARPSMEVET